MALSRAKAHESMGSAPGAMRVRKPLKMWLSFMLISVVSAPGTLASFSNAEPILNTALYAPECFTSATLWYAHTSYAFTAAIGPNVAGF